MQINLGLFEFNNRSGYFLKPRELRRSGISTSYTPFADRAMADIVVQTASIDVMLKDYLKTLFHT